MIVVGVGKKKDKYFSFNEPMRHTGKHFQWKRESRTKKGDTRYSSIEKSRFERYHAMIHCNSRMLHL